MSQPDKIITYRHTKKIVGKPGYEPEPCTLEDMEAQLRHALKQIPFPDFINAYEASESISSTVSRREYHKSTLVREGDLIATVRHGGGEGYRLEIYILIPQFNQSQLLLSVKYLTDQAPIWDVAHAISVAYQRGG
jgi:hypothetical protein